MIEKYLGAWEKKTSKGRVRFICAYYEYNRLMVSEITPQFYAKLKKAFDEEFPNMKSTDVYFIRSGKYRELQLNKVEKYINEMKIVELKKVQ